MHALKYEFIELSVVVVISVLNTMQLINLNGKWRITDNSLHSFSFDKRQINFAVIDKVDAS